MLPSTAHSRNLNSGLHVARVPLERQSTHLSLTQGAPRRPMVLLAPQASSGTRNFARVLDSSARYDSLLGEVQNLRGQVYLADGAISADQLTADGRFVHPADAHSWHLAIFDEQHKVAGCTRFQPHGFDVRFEELALNHSALARSSQWGPKLRAAVEQKIGIARQRGVAYVELGGWALAPSIRFTTEAMKMVLYQYGLAKVLGGALGISTATTRHHSSSILRRIGGNSLEIEGEVLPPYYDPHYDCEMEVLGFDSETPNPKYLGWIEECRQQLAMTPVLTSSGKFRESLDNLKKAIEPVKFMPAIHRAVS